MALISCPECGKEISDKAFACPHCGNPMNPQPQQQVDGEEQASPKPVQDDSVEPRTINNSEAQHAYDDKKNESIKNTKSSKKKPGCLTVIIIAVLILFANFFLRPMAKLYMRQRMNHQTEASGVYGAGLDRAEPIMDKLRKETPSTLGFLGELKKVYYGIGTITMEFKKADYENSPSGNAAKKHVIAEIQAMPNSLKKIMKEIVEEDFSLSIEISSGEIGTGSTIINLSPNEIEKALN